MAYLQKRESAMNDSVQAYFTEWEEYNKLFENIVTEDDNGIINVNFPTEFSVIETRMSKEYQSLPASRLIPTEEGDFNNARMMEDLLANAEANGQWDFQRFLLILAKHVLGTSIQKNMIRREVVKRKIPVGRIKRGKKKGQIDWKEMEVMKFDDIYKKYVRLDYFRIDDKATSMEDAEDCLEYMPMSLDTFHEKYPSGSIYKNTQYVLKDNSDADLHKEESKEEEKRMKFPDEVVVTEYINEVKDLMLVRANGVLILEQPNPYMHKKLPYVRKVATLLMNSFYGRGAPRLLKSIKAIKNILWNTALRTSLMGNKPVVVMRKSHGNKEENYEFDSGAVWKVPFDPNEVRILESNGVKQDMIQLIRAVDDEIPLAYGVDPRAILPSSKETATKTSTREEISNVRIELGIKLDEMVAQVRSTKMDISNIKQLYSEKRVKRILERDAKGGIHEKVTEEPRKIRFANKKFETKKLKKGNKYFIDGITPLKGEYSWLEMRPEFLNSDFDIQVTTTQIPFSKAFRQKQSQKFYETMQGHPNIDQAILVGGYVEDNDGDKDELVIDPQEKKNPLIPMQSQGGISPEQQQLATEQ